MTVHIYIAPPKENLINESAFEQNDLLALAKKRQTDDVVDC